MRINVVADHWTTTGGAGIVVGRLHSFLEANCKNQPPGPFSAPPAVEAGR